jgi:phosphoglycolate phosphatase
VGANITSLMPYCVSESTLGRNALSWDQYDAYLFDLDGTLLNCADAVHYYAFCDALHALSGKEMNLDGITTHGNTDAGILRDSLMLAGLPEEHWRPRISEACTRMCAYVHSRKSELNVIALPGAIEVLDHLRSRGAILGVATGNLNAIGRLKLENCGLLEFFQFGAFSDGLERRADVFRDGIVKARSLSHCDASLCVVGDTPADVSAAHENYLDVIAVASGVHSLETLAAASPELCVPSLEHLLALHLQLSHDSDRESSRIQSPDA